MNKQQYKSKYDSMTLSEWMLYHQRNIHFKMKYHDLDMQKNPCDLIIYSEIIYEVQPDYIIEIGGAGGGTALWLCHQLDILKKGQVISLDINHGGFKAEHGRLIKVTGDSTKKETVDELLSVIYPDLKRKASFLIIHDGSHKKEDIKKDFNNYSKFVGVGSYFIIEDGVMDVFNWKDHRTSGHDCGLCAGQEIANENEGWIIDESREKYIITSNQQGFLKRIK